MTATRVLPLFALCLASLPLATAAAHDSNLARWDMHTRGSELVLELRTSQAALHESLRAASPQIDGASYDTDTYQALLRERLGQLIRPEEDGAVLVAQDVRVVLGHESRVTMTFARATDTPPSRLRVDLSAFSSRPNQHHLVYVHAASGRQRLMLRPIDAHVLRWSAASGLVRTRGGAAQ